MKIRKPDAVGVYAGKESRNFAFADELAYGDIKINISAKGENLGVDLTADGSPVRYIRLRWNFTDSEKRKENTKILGDEWERGYGLMEWRGISAERCMPWVCMVSNGSDRCTDYTGRRTECFGVKVRPNAMCFWQYEPTGIILWLDVRCGGSGVVLKGRTVELCEIVFAEYLNVSAFSAIKEYYHLLCEDALPVPHKVYGTNTWYYTYGKISSEGVLADTDLLTERCKGLENIPYMVVDDGWEQNHMDAPWDKVNERFSDMKKLADEIRKRGARPGIWFRPLSDEKRATECTKDEHRSMRDMQYLDPSHPDVLEYIRKTVKMLVDDWGYEFVKHDFSTWDAFGFWGFERPAQLAEDGWHFWDQSRTSAEIMLEFYRAVYESAGEKALILGCNVIGHLAAGLVHLNRTGDDTSGMDWERTRNYGVNTLAFRMMHHEAFFQADADCAPITEKIDWKLGKEWLNAVAASGTPLFVSPAPNCMTDDQISELKKAYARNSIQRDLLEPLDWMENVCPEYWRLNGEEIHFNWYPEDGVKSFDALAASAE